MRNLNRIKRHDERKEKVEMLRFIVNMAGLWIYATMLFWANPLNDAMRPDSPMNPYSERNFQIKENIKLFLKEHGRDPSLAEKGRRSYDIWPTWCPIITALFGIFSLAITQTAWQLL